jgi:carbonic anhydrase
MSDVRTPAEVWSALVDGNVRFAEDRLLHPNQDPERRQQVAASQSPKAVVFGCSDSRVAAEILFDQGLGDLFVVRNAGHVLDESAVASIEYGVGVLGAPLVVVLEHQYCGAVGAAIAATGPDAPMLPPRIAAHIARIAPAASAVRTRHPGESVDADEVGRVHLEHTVAALLEASELVDASVANGSLAVVGASYRLTRGLVERRFAIGEA